MRNNILVTGGAGFVGSHLTRFLINKYSESEIINLDCLTYASNINYLKDIHNKDNYNFIQGDICNLDLLNKIFKKYKINKVIHLAAESHVDKSIKNPFAFAKTNVIGTLSLLETANKFWSKENKKHLFYYISTDEVFGSANSNDVFNEKSIYNPSSPYSASKASADHFVNAYHKTYNLPTVISHCSNNYGPCQFDEKLIPKVITNIIKSKNIPIYGEGKNIRDWIHVIDHVNAIDTIFNKGNIGYTYCVGGSNEISNLNLINMLIEITDKLLGRKNGFSKKLTKNIPDRLGHDFRYAVDSSKIKSELGWKPKINFTKGLEETVNWYIQNTSTL